LIANQDYRCSITAPVSQEEAFDKISQVSKWWAESFQGSARSLGDTFTVTFGDTVVDFKISEVVGNDKIVWDVVDCNLPWLSDKKEWNNTSVVWELSSENGTTTISMTHVGLVPTVECYEGCEEGWNFFVTQSLLQYLTEGIGQPKANESCS
jgi:hypothetical protein